MSANGVSRLATKEARQKAKLDLAAAKRQGKVVADDGSVTGNIDSTQLFYRGGNVYDLTSLPNPYDVGTNTVNADDTPNAAGLIQGRPWLLTSLVAAPETLAEALPPSVLVELESWYAADNGALFVPSSPVDGATFTQWLDGSSYAHNANPIGGATTRASYQTNELNTLNVVRFDGNDGLSINPYPSLASAAALTVFVVMKMTATTGNPRIWTTNSGATEFYYDSTASKFVVEAAGGVGVSTVSNAAGFHIHTFAFDGKQTTNANSLKYRYNKTDITLTFSGTVGDTMSALNTTLFIGNANGSNFFTGDIAEFLIFTKALTVTQLQNVENYLSNKWGV